MQAFLVYGWIGGAAYLALVMVTLAIGFRAALVPAPWQAYLIAGYAAFVGEAVEGFIVDTDHWRHFFLVLGLIWVLIAGKVLKRAGKLQGVRSRSIDCGRRRPAPDYLYSGSKMDPRPASYALQA